MNCLWLPDFYKYPDWENYEAFEEELYSLFQKIYLIKELFFCNKIIKYRFHPKFKGREEIFYHLTCNKFDSSSENERDPDPERIIRIKWPPAFIINYLCVQNCCSAKPLYWIKKFNKNYRHKIFFENYIVILEERDNYFLLVTAFYVPDEYYRKGLIKEYEKFKAKSAT